MPCINEQQATINNLVTAIKLNVVALDEIDSLLEIQEKRIQLLESEIKFLRERGDK